MRHQSLAQSAPAATGFFESAFPSVAERHDLAIEQLRRQFDRGQPLAVVAADGKFETNHVLSRFVADLDQDVAVVRLTKPYATAVEGMRAINRALGFDPKDLSAADLQKVLQMFLEFQDKHQRRTIIAVEQTERQAAWMLDAIARLVKDESRCGYGLMIVLAGKCLAFPELLNKAPLDGVRRFVGQKIVLAPFTPAETTEFVRQRVQAAGAADISQLFEFDAISRLHDLSGGVPDEVAKLCCKCLQTANLKEAGRISTQMVASAAAELRSMGTFSPTPTLLESTINEEIRGFKVTGHRLVVRLNDRWVKNQMLEKGSVLLGRGDQCDVCLPSRYVSRRHALISKRASGHVLRDLGSRNGTFVGSARVGEYDLEPEDVIRVGNFVVEYQSISTG